MNVLSFWKPIFFVLLVNQYAYALIVKLSDLHTMAKRSDLIIHGFVGEQKITTDDLGRLITLTDIEVIDGLYGAKSGQVITVYQVGGHMNGLFMPIIGGQIYKVGEEVILFGLKLGNTFVSYGAGLGKLDVIKQNGEEMVVEDLGDVLAMPENPGDIKNNRVFRPTPLSFQSAALIKDEIRLMLETR